jgi:hypothetical protein
MKAVLLDLGSVSTQTRGSHSMVPDNAVTFDTLQHD